MARRKSPVSIIIAVAAVAVTIAQPELAPATILGSTTLASAATGAVIGAGAGTLSSAVSGGNVLRGALTGGITGAVGGAVGSGVTDFLSPSATQLANAAYLTGPSFAGAASISPTAAALTPVAGQAAAQLSGRTAQALLSGNSLGQALQQGAISSIPGAVTGAAFNAADFGLPAPIEAAARGVSNQVVGSGVQSIFGAQRGSDSFGQTPQSPSPTAPPTQTDVASYALSQALRTAPDLGYSPGAAVLGGSGTDNRPEQSVWNTKSLRYENEK